jgi:hypothetical protein
MKYLYIYAFFPYPFSVIVSLIGVIILAVSLDGNVSSIQKLGFGEALAPPGVFVFMILISLIQFFLGSVPLFFLQKKNCHRRQYLIVGLVVAGMSALSLGFEGNREYLMFVCIFFVAIIFSFNTSFYLLSKSKGHIR